MASDYFLEKSLKSLAFRSKSPLKQIKRKHKIFMTKHPEGTIKRSEMIEIFSSILPERYSEHLSDIVLKLFGNIDRNEISFENVIMSEKIIGKWTNEEKLIWLFNLLDRLFSNSNSFQKFC